MVLGREYAGKDSSTTVCDETGCISWDELVMRFAAVEGGTHFLNGGNSIEQAAVILGAASGLCSAVPMNPRWTEQERETIRKQFDGKSDPPGVFIATSGSGGRPKIVHLTPDAMMQHALAVNQHLEIDDEDVWLACLPFYHVGGMSIVLRCALARAGLIIMSSSNADEILANLRRGVTIASFVPTTLRRLSGLRDFELPSSVRAILLGGGPVSRELIERLPQVLPTYGLTETGSMVTCARPGCDELERGTAGVPLSGAKVRIVDESGNELPEGATGRIVVKSDGAATGFWQDKTETARTFREGWIYTEDSGFLDARGCLHVLGRRDRTIISGGENVVLDEVEAAVRSLPGIRDVMCIGLEDIEWGQIVAAVIDSDGSYSLDTLRAQLRNRLAGHKLPRNVVTVSELPILSNGKPDYVAAKKLFG